jgi:hypothetical protein
VEGIAQGVKNMSNDKMKSPNSKLGRFAILNVHVIYVDSFSLSYAWCRSGVANKHSPL